MKITITEVIHQIHSDNYNHLFRVCDLPEFVQENDIIDITRNESFYSENNSWNSSSELIISREREETDEEYDKRKSIEKKRSEELKQRRYENYLKLKEEFEK